MATINVPFDEPTINDAVIAANPGDTIVVAPGIYEEIVLVDKTVTILGARAGIDARTRTPVGESIVSSNLLISGEGVFRVIAPDVIIDGFTINSNPTISGTAAIISGDGTVFPPNTNTIDVTGLQVLNNIITNNANGVVIASVESVPKLVNYLIEFNLFANNNGPSPLNGRGIYFTNITGTGAVTMSDIIISDNTFDGGHTTYSVLLDFFQSSQLDYNIINIDSGFLFSVGNTVTTNKNVFNQTTNNSFLLTNNTNFSITNSLIYNSSSDGINFSDNNVNVTITGNCIVGNNTGININATGTNSGYVIQNNNIESNTVGLAKTGVGYTGTVNVENNYWGSDTGPDYNGVGPGTGQPITETGVQQIIFTSFLEDPINCPSPIVVTKTTSSVNVPPGDPVQFTYEITVLPNDVPFVLTSVLDQLPQLNSGAPWTISSQNPAGTFIITGANPQFLTYNGPLPTSLIPGTYTVTIETNTNILDAGQVLDNDATTDIQIADLSQSYLRTASASMLICIHSTSEILMADGSQKKMMDVQSGDQIETANGQIAKVIENVECVAGVYNRYYGACVIFEKDSVAPGIPSNRFAIDANHPMALKIDSELKPAREYLNEKTIYKTYWDAVAELLPSPNRRYDLVLEGGSSYIANGVIVQSRKSKLEPGYEYNGGDYVDKIINK